MDLGEWLRRNNGETIYISNPSKYLMDFLVGLTTELGRMLTEADTKSPEFFCSNHFDKFLGLETAIETAWKIVSGIALDDKKEMNDMPKKISQEKIIAAIQAFANRTGRLPTVEECTSQNDLPSYTTIFKNLGTSGSWGQYVTLPAKEQEDAPPPPTEDPAHAKDPAPAEEPEATEETTPVVPDGFTVYDATGGPELAEEPEPTEDPAPAENPTPAEKPEATGEPVVTSEPKLNESGRSESKAPSDSAPTSAPESSALKEPTNLPATQNSGKAYKIEIQMPHFDQPITIVIREL